MGTMSRINVIHKALTSEPYEVTWKPKGNSMTPMIKSGATVRLKKIDSALYRVGDAVYAKRSEERRVGTECRL